MVLGTVLLGLKGAGLAVEARAQEQQAQMQAAPPADQAADSNDPASDDADTSSAQVDVLASLAKRRTELDARERDLGMRENLIAAAEKRVDAKIDALKQLQTQIQTLLAQRDDADQKQLAALVKTYSTMAPKDAARIFDNLNDDVLLAVAQQMKPADLGAVLAKMQSQQAEKLTARLANRLKLPEAQAATAQLASAATPQTALPGAAPATPGTPPAAPAPAAAAAPTGPQGAPQTAPPAPGK